MIHKRDAGREILLPRTLPVRTIDDYAPYHFVTNDAGDLSLRQGAPPKAVKAAAADFAEGRATLNDFLDRVGVPKP